MTATNNPKELEGMKKQPYAHVPLTALREQAKAHQTGSIKYGHLNFREEGIDCQTYYNAAMRHLLAWREACEAAHKAGADIAHLTDDQRLEFGFDEIDERTGIRCSHMGYLMANGGVIEDAMCHGKIIDNLSVPEVKEKTSGKPSNVTADVGGENHDGGRRLFLGQTMEQLRRDGFEAAITKPGIEGVVWEEHPPEGSWVETPDARYGQVAYTNSPKGFGVVGGVTYVASSLRRLSPQETAEGDFDH